MVAGFCLWRFDSAAPTIFFRGFCYGLTVCRFNDWQNFIGFHGAFMGFFLGGLYMRKLGFIPSVVSVSFPDSFNGNKKRGKGGQPLQTNLFVFPLPLAIGNE